MAFFYPHGRWAGRKFLIIALIDLSSHFPNQLFALQSWSGSYPGAGLLQLQDLHPDLQLFQGDLQRVWQHGGAPGAAGGPTPR